MYDALLDEWDLPRPRTLERATWGISNETHFVSSDAGDHVLRLYTDRRLEAIRFEQEILRRLIDAELPFRIPTPVATRQGDTVALDIESARYAVLFPRIPGEPLDDDHQEGVRRAGEAFARLDLALAEIARTDLPSPIFTGDLRTVHPAITDLAQLEQVVGAPGRRLVEDVAVQAPPIYASLPTQLVHGDFAFGNVLMRSGRVRGVLDFEYVGRAVRASDLAGAVAVVLSKGTAESVWRPLLRGYLSTLRLDATEIAAIPALALLHQAVILVWWAGRTLDGHMRPDGLAGTVERAVALERWMTLRGRELVGEALGATA